CMCVCVCVCSLAWRRLRMTRGTKIMGLEHVRCFKCLSIHSLNLDCHGANPKQCPEAEVPDNGGLACVTVANRRYCKPLCEHGYDFAFLRRSRPYEECSAQTRFQWQTQYVGGNKLAVCHVSGVKTAYFPKDQDCLTTKTSNGLQSGVIVDLTAELMAAGVHGAPQSACLVCG
uniref:Si:ch1073-126c3.2 n=1 Tax=Cyclopterus lumpus TaxID=8103 RepID=A0A8C2Z1Y9_CYCLU